MLAYDVVGRNKPKKQPDERVGPTPETKAKAQADIIDVLQRRGSLSQGQAAAAVQVREAVKAKMAGALASSFENMRELAMTGGFVQGGRRSFNLWPRDVSPLIEAYDYWRVMVGRTWSGKSTHLEIVLDILLDGLTTREADLRHGLRSGACANVLRDALDLWPI